jgi:hypothetical protein
LRLSPNNVVTCNYMHDVGQDMVFEGNCKPTMIQNNKMGLARHGLVLLNGGSIGPETPTGSPSGNLWSTNVAMVAQTYVVNSPAPGPANAIYMICGIFGGYTYCPTVNIGHPTTSKYTTSAPASLVPTGGSQPTCVSPVACSGKSQLAFSNIMAQFQPPNPVPAYSQIVSDTTIWPVNNFPGKWISRKHVFDNLYTNPSMISADSTLNAFYGVNLSGSYGQFSQVDDNISQLNFTSAQTTNSGVSVSTLQEANQQGFNNLLLMPVINSSYIYTSSDINALYRIANQCPLVGGQAVFAARAQLNFITRSVILFDDSCEFNENDRHFVRKDNLGSSINSPEFKLYPNPNDGNMVLEYAMDEDGVLSIDGIEGSKQAEIRISKDANRISISEGNLANGIYLITVKTRNKTYYRQRVVITK